MGDVVPFRHGRKPNTEAEVLIYDSASKMSVSHIARLLVYKLDESWTQEEVLKVMDELGVEARRSN